MGRALLAAIALGLLGYALWRLVEGALVPERRGSDVKALAVRTSFIVRGLVHGLLALSAAKLALGKPSSGDGEKEEQATRTAFELPAGDVLCGPPQSVSWATECTSSTALPRRSRRPARHGRDVQRGRPLGYCPEPVRHRRARHRFHRHRLAGHARSTPARSERSRRSARCGGTLQDFGERRSP